MDGSFKSRSWFYTNLANFVTVTRLLLASWLICLAIWDPEQINLMCLLVILCAWSDMLDGYLARKLEITSKIGGFLDRLSDKVFICSLIIFIAWGRSADESAYWWLGTLTQSIVGVIILFEGILMVSGVWGSFKGLNVRANRYGKIKMTLESIAVILWFVSRVAAKHWHFGMHWPLLMADVVFVLSIFYALKSIQGYADEFWARGKHNHNK